MLVNAYRPGKAGFNNAKYYFSDFSAFQTFNQQVIQEFFKQALSHSSSEYFDYYLNLGSVYYAQGKLSLALENFQKSPGLNPDLEQIKPIIQDLQKKINSN